MTVQAPALHRRTPLALAPASDIRVHTRKMSNGVTLLAMETPHLASASVGVFVRAGSINESAKTSGLSHFIEHMAFKGTATRTVQDINLEAEMLGAELNAFTDKNCTCYYMQGLGGHTPQMLELLSDIVLNSTFPEEEIDRERKVILHEFIEQGEDPSQVAMLMLDVAMWGAHPVSRPIIGTAENIARFTREDLLAYVAQHYVGDNIVVAAAGDFAAEDFFSQATKHFAAVAARAGAATPMPPLVPYGNVATRRLTSAQLLVTLAWPLALTPEMAYLGPLAAVAFGGGMSSPLVDRIRERMGLAYTLNSSTDMVDSNGCFVVDAMTTQQNLPAFSAALADLMRQHVTALCPQQLERAKNMLSVSLVMAEEQPLSRLQNCVEQLWIEGRVQPISKRIAQLRDVTVPQLESVFRRMTAQPAAVVLVGSGASKAKALSLQAELTQ